VVFVWLGESSSRSAGNLDQASTTALRRIMSLACTRVPIYLAIASELVRRGLRVNMPTSHVTRSQGELTPFDAPKPPSACGRVPRCFPRPIVTRILPVGRHFSNVDHHLNPSSSVRPAGVGSIPRWGHQTIEVLARPPKCPLHPHRMDAQDRPCSDRHRVPRFCPPLCPRPAVRNV